jgi:hypothetical protein
MSAVDEFDLDIQLWANQHVRVGTGLPHRVRLEGENADDSNTCYSTCADPECGGGAHGTNGDCDNPPPNTNGDCNPEDRPTRTFTCPINTCDPCPRPNVDDSNTCYSTCADPECGGGGGGDSNTCFSTCSDCPTVHPNTCVGACDDTE